MYIKRKSIMLIMAYLTQPYVCVTVHTTESDSVSVCIHTCASWICSVFVSA